MRRSESTGAWLIGNSLASLASAVFLINSAKVPASQIHLIETSPSPGDGLHNRGNPFSGYDYVSGCMPNFSDKCMLELLSMVPSTKASTKSIAAEILESCPTAVRKRDIGTRLLIQQEFRLKEVSLENLKLGFKERLRMSLFIARNEKKLGRSSIQDYFPGDFFRSTFWSIWSTQFGFQTWHSAVEFRRSIIRFLRDFHSLNDLRTVDWMKYNQHDSVILPITRYLQSEGVDFQVGTKVTEIITDPRNEHQSVSGLRLLRGELEDYVTLGPDDIAIITIGSVASGSTAGTNTSPAEPQDVDSEEELHDGWLLWLELGKKHCKFGNPRNFYSRMAESTLTSFTITTYDIQFFNQFVATVHDEPGSKAFVSLQDSQWQLSISIPHQPLFPCQPDGAFVIWGYALSPGLQGDYIRKPMYSCSGDEILTELILHLNFPSHMVFRDSTTIPRVMPRATSMSLTRFRDDRPVTIPERTSNIALVGQFVEIPGHTCVGAEYSVRGAQMAVDKLMGLDKSRRSRSPVCSTILRLLLCK